MKLWFGKHVGKEVKDLVVSQPDYLQWLLKQDWLDPRLTKEINMQFRIFDNERKKHNERFQRESQPPPAPKYAFTEAEVKWLMKKAHPDANYEPYLDMAKSVTMKLLEIRKGMKK